MRNQRALWKELEQRAASCSDSAPLAVVVLDFDRLGELNERYDRAVGDAVLRAGAEAARDEAPSPRLAFRYADDDLVLLVPGDEEDGRELAERLRARIAAQNSDLPAVTVSCGVAAFESPAEPAVALDRAYPALRAAKRAGGNRVALATESGLNGDDDQEAGGGTARRAALAVAVASLEARDRATADHSDDVVTLCDSIGRRLGLSETEHDHLTAGARLHDVGKMAMPREILNKEGPLDDDEWAVIREHTVIGERILRSVPEMAAVATLVRHSHERWDGSGYPDGLAGEEIPLASRIILCADAFHAIRSDRPYRPGRSADEAITEVRSWAGRQFDPRVVEALVSVARDVRGRVGAATALPRSRRLAALLAALAVGGGGSAYAASEDVRDTVGGAVDVLVPGTTVEPAGADTPDFSLRPLAEVPSIDPIAIRSGEGLGRHAFEGSPAQDDTSDRTTGRADASAPAPLAQRDSEVVGGVREPVDQDSDASLPAGTPDKAEAAPPESSPGGNPELTPVAELAELDSTAEPELTPVAELAPAPDPTPEPTTVAQGDAHGGLPAKSKPHGGPPAKDKPPKKGNAQGEPPVESVFAPVESVVAPVESVVVPVETVFAPVDESVFAPLDGSVFVPVDESIFAPVEATPAPIPSDPAIPPPGDVPAPAIEESQTTG